MRILHFVDSEGLYGAEAVLLELVRHQQRKGHQTAIVSIGAPSCGEKALEREARQRGLSVHPVRMMNGPNLRGAADLIALARREGADILHSHGYKTNILLGFLPRWMRGRPLVSTIHGYTHGQGFDRMRLYQWLDARAVRRCDAVVLVHRGMLTNPSLAGFDHRRLQVVENGIADADGFAGGQVDARIIKFCERGPVIGAIGRLSPEKGLDRLIAAFGSLVRSGLDGRLLILGEGPLRPALEHQAAELGLTDRILMPGFVDGRRHLSFLNVFVLPSLSEGLPICLLEAMRAGVPIVASRVGGVPGVLEDGKCGLLVDPGDVEGMARAIREVLTSDVLARNLLRDAQTAVRAFSSERMTDRYLEVYANLLPQFAGIRLGDDRTAFVARSESKGRVR